MAQRVPSYQAADVPILERLEGTPRIVGEPTALQANGRTVTGRSNHIE
jgi:hypothetical protein